MKHIKIVHCKKEKYDIYIGRPSIYGNPFEIGKDGTREEVIEKHMEWLIGVIEIPNAPYCPTIEDIRKLKGNTLGCWCSPKPCHGENYDKILEDDENERYINEKTNRIRKDI